MATIPADTPALEVEATAQPSGFRRPLRLAAAGLVLGTAFEYLFYGRPLGVSFAIWTWLCLAALIGLGWQEGVKPSAPSLGLGAAVAVLSVLPAFRSEPLTVFLDVILTLCGLALLVRTYRSKDLMAFGFADFGLGLVIPPLEAWFRPWRVLSETQARLLRQRQSQSTLAGVGRGLLLAFPILIVFLVLLSSADLVFGDYVKRALDWLDLARFFEYMGRLTVLILSGLFTLGALVAALRRAESRRLVGLDQPLLSPFIGFTEIGGRAGCGRRLVRRVCGGAVPILVWRPEQHHSRRVHLRRVRPPRLRRAGVPGRSHTGLDPGARRVGTP